MISVEEALTKIDLNTHVLGIQKVALHLSLHQALAELVMSPIDMPPFRQSAMDGYALNYDESISDYVLVGEIAAGSYYKNMLKPGEAVRIFTGAAVPDSANLVAQQEIINRINNKISITETVKIGQNIRPTGEQIQANKPALKAGHVMSPASVGYLASLGITEVAIYKKPKIGLLTTGNELVPPGETLGHGQIFESNSMMLAAALKAAHFDEPFYVKAEDDLATIQAKLTALLATNDVVLISGGISVGDYDYVKKALENIGVTEVFHKVKQKPGKPFYFGTLEKKLIFALPGNPASALTCFYIYVLRALFKLAGRAVEKPEKILLKNTYEKKAGLAHFLKSHVSENEVTILPSQSSAMLNTFAEANALVYIPEPITQSHAGSLVTVYRILQS